VRFFIPLTHHPICHKLKPLETFQLRNGMKQIMFAGMTKGAPKQEFKAL